MAFLAFAWACSGESYRLGGSGPQNPGGVSGFGAGFPAGRGGVGAGSGSGGGGGVISITGGVAGSGAVTGVDGGCPSGCRAASYQVTRPSRSADVVLAVDTAGTPVEKLTEVERELNRFAARLVQNFIDLRLVVLAARQEPPGICVPAPLGSGMCVPQGADSRPGLFHHPTAIVDDGNALEVIIDEYPTYSAELGSPLESTLLVVTGGDAAAPWNDPTAFIRAYSVLRPPAALPWKMAAYYAFSQCQGVRAEGRVYRALVELTGGVQADLCTESAQTAFDRIAASILDRVLPCRFELPEPTPGDQVDYTKINVELRTGASLEPIFHVPSAGDCDAQLGGWYYDDPVSSSVVVLCPASCARLHSSLDATLSIVFGCLTIPFPPGCP